MSFSLAVLGGLSLTDHLFDRPVVSQRLPQFRDIQQPSGISNLQNLINIAADTANLPDQHGNVC